MIRSGLSNLQQRTISALVLAAIVLLVTLAGGWAWRLLVCAIAMLVFLEWLGMAPVSHGRPAWPLIIGAFSAAILVVLLGSGAWAMVLAGLAAGLVAATLAEVHGLGLWVARGFAYAFLPAFALVMLRGDTQAGLVAVLFLYAVVWSTDIGAYFVGRKLGGPRLAPTISPGKTWSGAVGGLLTGIIGGAVLAALAGQLSPAVIMTAILLSVAGQLGDLFESSVKREANVKDSSQLIPGHGGVMDRVDALAFAAIAFYLIGAAGSSSGQAAGALF